MTTFWAQHTRLTAADGRRDDLVSWFNEVPELQRDNPAHVLTVVGVAGRDGVTLTEVWTSEAEHQAATQSDAVTAWAAGMSELVDGEPSTEQFTVVGGNLVTDR
jgi:quinol monooxygenase YgiN